MVTTLADRYRLIERLGAGGMSVVWRAYDGVLGRQVAVKVLAGDFATAPGFRDRIRREAQAAARLSHPAITNVFDYGEALGADGVTVPFVVMELVDGESVAQRLASGPLPWRSAVDLAVQVADALATAHARGLVHRDITPGNVMLTGSGVKVVDFGISAVEGELEGSQLLGTPAYLSPERLSGAPAQPATDVYSLGVLLCQVLTGHTPVAGRLSQPVPGLPAEASRLVEQCLATDPAARPGAGELASRLRPLVEAGSRGSPAPGPLPGTRPIPPEPVGPRGTRVLPPPPPPPPPPAVPAAVLAPLPPLPPAQTRRRRLPLALLGLAGVLVLGCGALLASNGQGKGGTARATISRSPTPSPTPLLVCAAQYKITADWKVGFTATLKIDVRGTKDVTGWSVDFDFPGNQDIDGGWPGKYTQTGKHVTIKNDNWNAVLEAGKSYSTGIVAHYTGKNEPPAKITLNGVTCTAIAA